MSTGVPWTSSNSGNLREIRHRIHGVATEGRKEYTSAQSHDEVARQKGSVCRGARNFLFRVRLSAVISSASEASLFLSFPRAHFDLFPVWLHRSPLPSCSRRRVNSVLPIAEIFLSPEGRKTDRKFRWNCWERVSDTEKNLSSQPVVGSSLSLSLPLSLFLSLYRGYENRYVVLTLVLSESSPGSSALICSRY